MSGCAGVARSRSGRWCCGSGASRPRRCWPWALSMAGVSAGLISRPRLPLGRTPPHSTTRTSRVRQMTWRAHLPHLRSPRDQGPPNPHGTVDPMSHVATFDAVVEDLPGDWSFFEAYVALDDPNRLSEARVALARAN